MGKYTDRCIELRASIDPRYNCCQAVIVPFAEDAGLTEEQVCRLTAHFGGGMRRASTCGAIVGGLMALGLFGIDSPQDTAAYYNAIRENHSGCLDCADLLRMNKEAGGEKKTHCDAMCTECIGLVEKILAERSKTL